MFLPSIDHGWSLSHTYMRSNFFIRLDAFTWYWEYSTLIFMLKTRCAKVCLFSPWESGHALDGTWLAQTAPKEPTRFVPSASLRKWTWKGFTNLRLYKEFRHVTVHDLRQSCPQKTEWLWIYFKPLALKKRSLPWKKDPRLLPNNYPLAERRLESLERSFSKNEENAKIYSRAIEE